MAMFKFNCGDEVKDSITGFTGVVVARTEWMNGCLRYVVQSKKREVSTGKAIEDNFDEGQLSLLHPKKEKKKKDRPGGPFPGPARLTSPRRF